MWLQWLNQFRFCKKWIPIISQYFQIKFPYRKTHISQCLYSTFRISRDYSEERSRNFQDRPHARPLHGCGHRGGLGRSHYRDGHGRGPKGFGTENRGKSIGKITQKPGKMVIQPRKIGDLWLIHDSEVGENGVADYSHFIGTWWLTIWNFGYPM